MKITKAVIKRAYASDEVMTYITQYGKAWKDDPESLLIQCVRTFITDSDILKVKSSILNCLYAEFAGREYSELEKPLGK